MGSGAKVAVAVGAGGAIFGLGYLLWRRFRPRGTPTLTQWNMFASIGDVNRDGRIDSIDLAIAQAAFGSTSGSSNWNPACDLNKDGKVDMRDISVVANNQGLNIWDYFGL